MYESGVSSNPHLEKKKKRNKISRMVAIIYMINIWRVILGLCQYNWVSNGCLVSVRGLDCSQERANGSHKLEFLC